MSTRAMRLGGIILERFYAKVIDKDFSYSRVTP